MQLFHCFSVFFSFFACVGNDIDGDDVPNIDDARIATDSKTSDASVTTPVPPPQPTLAELQQQVRAAGFDVTQPFGGRPYLWSNDAKTHCPNTTRSDGTLLSFISVGTQIHDGLDVASAERLLWAQRLAEMHAAYDSCDESGEGQPWNNPFEAYRYYTELGDAPNASIMASQAGHKKLECYQFGCDYIVDTETGETKRRVWDMETLDLVFSWYAKAGLDEQMTCAMIATVKVAEQAESEGAYRGAAQLYRKCKNTDAADRLLRKIDSERQ